VKEDTIRFHKIFVLAKDAHGNARNLTNFLVLNLAFCHFATVWEGHLGKSSF
jgi:hypothetical protein